MKFKLEFNMDNAAFEDNGREREILRVLDQATDHVLFGRDVRNLFDSNGNKIGSFEIIEE